MASDASAYIGKSRIACLEFEQSLKCMRFIWTVSGDVIKLSDSDTTSDFQSCLRLPCRNYLYASPVVFTSER